MTVATRMILHLVLHSPLLLGGGWIEGMNMIHIHHGNPQPSFLGVISYNPYIGGLKPSFFMVLGSKGIIYIYIYTR